MFMEFPIVPQYAHIFLPERVRPLEPYSSASDLPTFSPFIPIRWISGNLKLICILFASGVDSDVPALVLYEIKARGCKYP